MLLTRFRTVILHVRQTIQLFFMGQCLKESDNFRTQEIPEEKEFLNLR